jgi:hypothetical protein
VDATATGFQVKSIIKPLVLVSAGLGGAILLRDKNLKLVASGVVAGGFVTGVKVFLKKDILNGLGDFKITDPLKRVFREPVNLAIAPYNPDLPQLPGHEEIPTMQIEEAPLSLGELEDYQEVQEVQIL